MMGGMQARASRTASARSAALVVWLLGSVAGLIYTSPLLSHFREGIPYGFRVSPEREVVGLVPGDHLQFFYFLSITGDRRIPLFRDGFEFSAPEPNPKLNLFFLPFSILFAAMAPLGEAAAYNLLVWLSFPATALSVFLLARRLGLDGVAAGIPAAAVTLLPYRVASVAVGHPTGFVFFLLPLIFLLLEKAWQERSRAAAGAAGLSLVILAVNEPHFVYFCGFLLPLWLLSVLWRLGPAAPIPAGGVASLGLLGLAAGGPTIAYASFAAFRRGAHWSPLDCILLWVVCWAVLWLAWRLTAEIRGRRSGDTSLPEAASYLPLLGLALYPVGHLLELPFFGRGLGVVILLGLFAAKLPCLRDLGALAGDPRIRTEARALRSLWPFAVGLAVTIGVVLYFKASTVDASVAASGRSAFEVALFSARPADLFRRTNTVLTRLLYPGAVTVLLAVIGLVSRGGRVLALVAAGFFILALGFGAPRWLPFYPLAFDAVPYFGMIRQPIKFLAPGGIALALAAGFGAAAILGRGSRLARAAVVALLAAMLVDSTSVLPFGISILPEGNRAYGVVAREARGTNLLELPLWPGDSAFSSLYQYWTTRTGVRIVNGYSPTAPRDYVERVVRPLDSMNLGEMSEAQHRLLGELGVRFVTLHRDAFPPQVSAYPYRFTLAAMRANPNLELRAVDEGVYLFEIRGGEYRPWSSRAGSALGVFYEAETLRLGSGRRIEDPGASGGTLVHGPVAGDSRPVVYGPYRRFPQGSYEARFRGRGRGRVEVTTDRGTRLLGESFLDGRDFHEGAVAFDLVEPTTLEFRAQAESPAALDLDWVLVQKLDPVSAEAAGRIEAEDLFARSGTHRETDDASAGAGAAVVASAAPAGSVVLDGPYRLYDAGRLRVRLRGRGGGFRLSIESADSRRRFGEIAVGTQASWQDFETTVEIPQREVVCGRVISTGADAEIDYVELNPEP